MTDFLKRLSRLSCDSPSRKVTVANTPTSFLLPDLSRHKKTGLRICVLDSSRVSTTLGCWLQPLCLI
jgi:hypothetical protein